MNGTKVQDLEKNRKIATAIAMTIFTLGFGIVGGGALVFLGFLLCLTIIGAIFGIPMILAGLALIIVSPFGGLAVLAVKKAECPYCHNMLGFNGRTKAIDCRYCKKRLLNQNGTLVLVV